MTYTKEDFKEGDWVRPNEDIKNVYYNIPSKLILKKDGYLYFKLKYKNSETWSDYKLWYGHDDRLENIEPCTTPKSRWFE